MMKATRAAYGEALAELSAKYPELVVLEADLSSATQTAKFAAVCPDRFFNCGIAEANMTGIAAGMSLCGLKPFTNTFAVFAAGRAYEQVRNSIAYPQLNVTVVGSHGGVSVGEDGATHQMVEDLALMRVIPGMTVVNPCDANEMKLAVEALIKHNGPAYLRLGRAPVETVTDTAEGYSFELGKGAVLRDGSDITIAATGLAVQISLHAAELLEQEGISARVLDIHTIKPLDEELILRAAQETGKVLTVEEHSVIGGLGGAVAELLGEKCPVPVFRHGIDDTFGRSGTAKEVLEYYGMSAEAVADRVLSIFGREKTPAPAEKTRYFLAIDLGAASGRHIVGWKEEGDIRTQEVYRFPVSLQRKADALIWDTDYLLENVKTGIGLALKEFPDIESFSIDTWGADYVLLDKDDKEIWPCYSYRDMRTEEVIPEVHGKMSFSELYSRTGCQFATFNTMYQLYADMKNGRLDKAEDMLMLPEYLIWKLTGVKAREYVNATTTGLVNAESRAFDKEIIDTIGLPAKLFPALSMPGTEAGSYRGMKCILCASHDTASAVEGIPMEENAPYIISGTWSLLGIKTKKPILSMASELGNWTNEGGRGYYRYQKNIIGMWLVDRLRDDLCPEEDYDSIVKMAMESNCNLTVDANEKRFYAPLSMKQAFDEATGCQLKTTGDYFRCAYRSIALSYMISLRELQYNTGIGFDTLYIVGGGAKNAFLTGLTEEAVGIRVKALPIEASALGGLNVQMAAAGA